MVVHDCDTGITIMSTEPGNSFFFVATVLVILELIGFILGMKRPWWTRFHEFYMIRFGAD